MGDEKIILPGSTSWHPNNDEPRPGCDSNWKCYEQKPAWLSWCQQAIDLDKVREHIAGCVICTEFFSKLVKKVELYP